MIKRSTKQKTVINDILAIACGPLTTQEIFELAKRKVPTIGVATVYRNIKLLLEEGKVKTIYLPEEVVRYEVAAKWEKHHHHFQCLGCAKTFDIDICDSDFANKVPSGFQVSRHEVMLWGLCADCKRGPKHK